jgi:hypothetical protein
MDSSFSELSTAAATDSPHELLVVFFVDFFFLGLSSWNPVEDKQKEPICLLATAQSLRLQKCLHPHHDDDDDDDEVLSCRLNNTFAVHKEPIILQQEQIFFFFLFFSFGFSLVCNSGSCN